MKNTKNESKELSKKDIMLLIKKQEVLNAMMRNLRLQFEKFNKDLKLLLKYV